MACLLLRCVAPMQSWGTRSRFQERDTEREPTKSGIIGLICAALGRDRAQPVNDLVALKMGVRVDREGIIERDFHTAMNVIRANLSPGDTQLSNRAYLADAAFLVGLEGERAVLETIAEALKNPHWPLFFGRKSFVPGLPVYLGPPSDETLDTALTQHPCLGSGNQDEDKRVRLIIECPLSQSRNRRQDAPVDFRHAHRQFLYRAVETHMIALPAGESRCI